ncbi:MULTISPECIES: energy transducer TonB [Novosphingobium]|uniref:energy transducer TonB n=1 Tax=unclassified Novosphingobium TaxID=2644732 RepID=UPI0006C84883|nr:MULTISPECIES: energy transducer TonB [unclassified Novosphingobium]TCM35397.1 outer membrane transport energization protein TonB [Novosphingobium sp. ST904]WRT95674.1 energy transducer TonB [Novosphingobium sp. RL4]
MTKYATIQQTDDVVLPERPRAQPQGEVVALPGAWAVSRYGEQRRPNIGAMLGATAIVGGMIASMLALNIVNGHQEARKRLVVADLEQPTPPPPPPPKSQPQPVKQVVQPVSPVVAPPPPIVLTSAPATISTSPEPPVVQVAIPGPPAPQTQTVAVAPAPRIENAGDLSSKMIAADPPRYPVESRRKREQGTVVLMVILGADGSVADISVSKSSGFERLDKAALSAVRRWKWSPTRRDGAAVMVRGLVEIPFVLQT